MSDILQKILATKYREVSNAQQIVSLDAMRMQAETAPPVRDFVAAISVGLLPCACSFLTFV